MWELFSIILALFWSLPFTPQTINQPHSNPTLKIVSQSLVIILPLNTSSSLNNLALKPLKNSILRPSLQCYLPKLIRKSLENSKLMISVLFLMHSKKNKPYSNNVLKKKKQSGILKSIVFWMNHKLSSLSRELFRLLNAGSLKLYLEFSILMGSVLHSMILLLINIWDIGLEIVGVGLHTLNYMLMESLLEVWMYAKSL